MVVLTHDCAQGYLLFLTATHQEDAVILACSQQVDDLFHQFQRINLPLMGRERRYGNPALPRLLFRHHRTGGHFLAVIQSCKIIRGRQTQLLKHHAIAVNGRRDGFAHAVIDEGLATCTLLVQTSHRNATKPHV